MPGPGIEPGTLWLGGGHATTALHPLSKISKWLPKPDGDAKVETNRLILLQLTFSTLKYVFQLINIIDDVMAVSFVEKTRALSRPQFSFNFLVIWYVSSITHY